MNSLPDPLCKGSGWLQPFERPCRVSKPEICGRNDLCVIAPLHPNFARCAILFPGKTVFLTETMLYPRLLFLLGTQE